MIHRSSVQAIILSDQKPPILATKDRSKRAIRIIKASGIESKTGLEASIDATVEASMEASVEARDQATRYPRSDDG
jgi:hypothetical protein